MHSVGHSPPRYVIWTPETEAVFIEPLRQSFYSLCECRFYLRTWLRLRSIPITFQHCTSSRVSCWLPPLVLWLGPYVHGLSARGVLQLCRRRIRGAWRLPCDAWMPVRGVLPLSDDVAAEFSFALLPGLWSIPFLFSDDLAMRYA